MSKIEIAAATSIDLARSLVDYRRSSDYLRDEVEAGEAQPVKRFIVASLEPGKPFGAMLIAGKAYILELSRDDVKTWLDAFDWTEAADGSQA